MWKSAAEERSRQRDEAFAVLVEDRRDREALRNQLQIVFYRVSYVGVLAILGRTDEALSELEAAQKSGYRLGDRLRNNPEFASLRREPRFQKLAAEAEALPHAQPPPKP
jgi:hypothetical protein